MEDRFWNVKTVLREGSMKTVAGEQGENDNSLASGDIAMEMEKGQQMGEFKLKSPGLNNTESSYSTET